MGQTILKEDLNDQGSVPVFSATEGDHYFGYIDNPVVKLHPGDLVIPARGSIGFVKLVTEPATTTQTTIYCKKVDSDVNSRFAYYFMRGNKKFLFQATQTAIPQITVEEVSTNPIVIPSISEQEQIVAFLDHETAKIDRLIAKQERLIELLKEKRQAVISHAVTKGLNPNVPMKDSGVEWLGEVPAHWVVGALKFGWDIIDCKHLTAPFVDDGTPLASIREVQSRVVDLSEAKKTTREYYLQLIEGGRKPRPGDIIYSRNATVGEAALVVDGPDFAMGQDVVLMRPRSQDSDYFLYQLESKSIGSQLDLLMVGATFKRINVGNIKNLTVAFPPLEEQRKISRHLSEVESKFDRLSAPALRAVELLREHRTALISAAVTGKIDVRGWQKPNYEPQEAAAAANA